MQSADVGLQPIRDQHLRLFFSADLAGGTDYKSRRPIEEFRPNEAWPATFERFFQSFVHDFQSMVSSARAGRAEQTRLMPPPQLWKINGDELLFSELVYPDPTLQRVALTTSMRAFVEVLRRFDRTLQPHRMGVRGCVWTAGFPLRNKHLRHTQRSIEILPADEGGIDPDSGFMDVDPPTIADFIGRDMDLGFRLSSVAPAGRIVCSLDAADFLLRQGRGAGVGVWHVGWKSLKGVLGGHPYPLFWLELDGVPQPRHPRDLWEADASPETIALLHSNRGPLDPAAFETIEQPLREQYPVDLVKPYASLGEIAQDHLQVYVGPARDESVRALFADNDKPERRDKISARRETVETITLDDLNQILLHLQENPDVAVAVRELLREVATDEAYIEWAESLQDEGRLFRLHSGLAFATDEQRRLLESLLLIRDDVLRVKVNAVDGLVFLTDGLWVPAGFRTFPFHDESDLITKMCRDQGWMDWATCVIDPAVGCGHNLLRYTGDARRVGFDRNARAVVYAAINAAINAQPVTAGICDVREGIPAVFSQTEPERVLVLANMPFALDPHPDALPRSASGGRHGYEATVELLGSIRRLAASLSSDAEVRCIVLAYSLGSLPDKSWVVPTHARDLLGPTAQWCELPEERIWRVNGRKEQENPMPLDRLQTKADCRFYVRDESKREAVRREYVALARELEREGYDHLSYGLVVASLQGEGPRPGPGRFARDASPKLT